MRKTWRCALRGRLRLRKAASDRQQLKHCGCHLRATRPSHSQCRPPPHRWPHPAEKGECRPGAHDAAPPRSPVGRNSRQAASACATAANAALSAFAEPRAPTGAHGTLCCARKEAQGQIAPWAVVQSRAGPSCNKRVHDCPSVWWTSWSLPLQSTPPRPANGVHLRGGTLRSIAERADVLRWCAHARVRPTPRLVCCLRQTV